MPTHSWMLQRKNVWIFLLLASLLFSPTRWTFAKGYPAVNRMADTAFRRLGFERIGQVGGEVYEVAENGSYIFAAVGARVYILDQSSIEKKEPVVIGKTEILEGTVSTIVAQDNTLFVGNGGEGVTLFDISNPGQPKKITTYSLYVQGTMKMRAQPAIIASGNIMYLGWGIYGWEIVDITNKASPRRIWKAPEGDYCSSYGGMTLKDNFLFFSRGCDGEFVVFDITDKTNPRQIGSTATNLGEGGAIVIGQNYAYLIGPQYGLRVIDISDPVKPVLKGGINTDWRFNGGAVIHGDFLYIGNWRLGLGVINIQSPTNPVFVKNYCPGGYINQVAVLNHFILMACDLFGVCVADLTNPADPVFKATLFFDAPSSIQDIEVRDHFLFVANEFNGLRIFDVASPSAPKPVSAYPDFSKTAGFEGFASSIAVDGDYAYLADNNGLRVIQISNIFAPNKVGQVLYNRTHGSTKNLVVSGDFLYLTDENTLEIYNIQNKANPWKVSAYTFPTSAPYISGLAIRDNLAWVADYNGGLRILNIQDPANPKEIGSFTSNNFSAVDVVLKGNLALVCELLRGLVILDITNPQNPVEIGHYTPVSSTHWIYSYAIAVRDDLVLLEGDDLLIIDISRADQPTLIGSHSLWGNSIKTSGDTTYLNGALAGVYILKQKEIPNIFIPLAVK